MDKPYKIKNIDLNNVSYSEIKGNSKKYVNIKYNNQKFMFQTPELLFINNIIEHQKYYELNIPLYGPKVDEFIIFLNELDKHIINDIINRRVEWNIENGKYKSLIRDVVDMEENEIYQNGMIKLKIEKRNKIIIRKNNKIVSLKDLSLDNYIKLIIECSALSLSNNILSIYLKPLLIDQKTNIELVDETEDDIIETDNKMNMNDSIISELLTTKN